MTYPKLKPCPNCGSDDVAAYEYEIWSKCVECLDCRNRGPIEGRLLDAIRGWNEEAIAAIKGERDE